MVDGRSQALRAEPIESGFAILSESVGDLLYRQVATRHAQVLGKGLLAVVIGGDLAHCRIAFGDLGIGTADRVLGDDQHACTCFRRSACCHTAGPTGADDDNVIIPPLGLDRHMILPPSKP